MPDSWDWITPSWPVPNHVKALSTTRTGGISLAPFDALNLGAHVNDETSHVEHNRKVLSAYLPEEPLWLNQVHGVQVIQGVEYNGVCNADASTTQALNQVCAVMTADCLPVLFCNERGTQVAAAHAGWRGLLDGVLERTVSEFKDANGMMAWLGPAIGPDAFEVGQEVKDGFCAKDSASESCFKPSLQANKWFADLYGLARLRLKAAGVEQVFGGEYCTFSDEARFFSYRRDGVTGRMATCIWLAE